MEVNRKISAGGEAAEEARRDDVRTWLQLVKTVLPMEREVNRIFAREFGQSLARFDVLAQLSRVSPDGLTVGLLAERLIASAGNITHLLSRMQREGLIQRQADDNDRRSQIVRVTSGGADLYVRMAQVHDGWVVDRLGCIAREDKETLKALLRDLREKRCQS